MSALPETPDRILRVAEVIKRTGLSRATLYRRMADGQFPRAVNLGGKAVGWRWSEVSQWIARLGQRVQP